VPRRKLRFNLGEKMAVTSVENQSNQQIQGNFQSPANDPWSSNQRTHRSERHSDRNSGDGSESRFHSSSKSGNQDAPADAGTYQVSQFQVFSASASGLLAQNGSPTQPTPSTATSTTPATQSQTAATQPVQPVASQTASPATTPATSAATTPSTSDGSTSRTPGPLQALNSVLQGLGLSQQDIQAFDQVASLIQSLSPAAFADLVSLFQNLAQQVSQASQNTPAATSDGTGTPASDVAATSDPTSDPTSDATAAPTPTTPATTPAESAQLVSGSTESGTSAPTGGIQIDELSIRFSALDIQGNTGNTGGISSGAGGSFDFSAFQLNLNEVNVTLSGSSAPTAQPASIQPPANESSPAAQPSAATAS